MPSFFFYVGVSNKNVVCMQYVEDQEKTNERSIIIRTRAHVLDMVRIANAAKRRRQKKKESSIRLYGVHRFIFHLLLLLLINCMLCVRVYLDRQTSACGRTLA